MDIITILVVPKNDSIYPQSNYHSCKACGCNILAGTFISVSEYDYQNLGRNNLSVPILCTKCTFKDIFHHNEFRAIFTDIIREELRKIIKEEVCDPKGPFSPNEL